MIFDTGYMNESTGLYSLDGIEESKYELGLNGALMHVYENECNYNALIRAVGLSELKYYNETGNSLFIHEAGAFSGFLAKAKAFFKKVIEKIKAIFKKFLAVINSYTMKDKEFIKKYETEILRKDTPDLEFNGYKKLNDGDISVSVIDTDAEVVYTVDDNTGKDKEFNDSDEVNDKIEELRGMILKKEAMSESEFKDELKNILYGDKDTFGIDSTVVRNALNTIKNTKSTIKTVENEQKAIIKTVDNAIKAIDKAAEEFEKDAKKNAPTNNKTADNIQKNASDMITINKSVSNDLTVVFGMIVQAAKDANKQARAICVKVLGYKKKESYGEAATDDLFSLVDFA